MAAAPEKTKKTRCRVFVEVVTTSTSISNLYFTVVIWIRHTNRTLEFEPGILNIDNESVTREKCIEKFNLRDEPYRGQVVANEFTQS